MFGSKKIFVLSLGLVSLLGCERIPEGERRSTFTKKASEQMRLLELRKWIFTCRANVGGEANTKTRSVGERIENLVDHFREKGLSTLSAAGAVHLRGTALLWAQNGYLVTTRDVIEGARDLECTNGATPWLKASVRGQDRVLDLAVLKVDIPLEQGIRKENHWLSRNGDFEPGESFHVIASSFPKSLDMQPVNLQPFGGDLYTGLDESLMLFLPAPNRVLHGGVLVDSFWRVVGYVLPVPSDTWGAAISLKRLELSVEALIAKGKVEYPHSGIRVAFLGLKQFVIQSIEVGSPAYEAGLRVDDVLQKWDGQELEEVSDWREPTSRDIGRSVAVTYQRKGRTVETTIRLSATE